MKKKIIVILIFSLFIATSVPAVESIKNNTINSEPNEIPSSDLPYWLDGTILDGNHRVLVTPLGRPLKDTEPGYYEYIISFTEQDEIFAQARQNYVQQYGTDPCQHSTVEQTILKDEVQLDWSDVIPNPEPLAGGYPHPMGRLMLLKVFFACDPDNKPNDPATLKSQTITACRRFLYVNKPFQITFIILMMPSFDYGSWSAYGTKDDVGSKLYDLSVQCSRFQNYNYEVIFGWVKRASDLNGMAYLHGFYGVGVETRDGGPLFNLVGKDVIVQHELSHMIGNVDDGREHDGDCLMDYFDACTGTHIWCKTCRSIIRRNLR